MSEKKTNAAVIWDKKSAVYTVILGVLFILIICHLGSAFREAILQQEQNDGLNQKICRAIDSKNYMEICFNLKKLKLTADFPDKRMLNESKQSNPQTNIQSRASSNVYQSLSWNPLDMLVPSLDEKSFNYKLFFSTFNIVLIFCLYFLFIALKRRVLNIVNVIEKHIRNKG